MRLIVPSLPDASLATEQRLAELRPEASALQDRRGAGVVRQQQARLAPEAVDDRHAAQRERQGPGGELLRHLRAAVEVAPDGGFPQELVTAEHERLEDDLAACLAADPDLVDPGPDDATLERTQGVVIDHLKRFAFREDLGEVRWERG